MSRASISASAAARAASALAGEVLRDLGREVEDEAYMFAAHQDLMGENVFCESLAGEEIGRMKAWGNHPLSKAEHLMSSPTKMNDLPQTFMEPLLYKTACSRGTQGRMSTEYLNHVQDAEGVTTTCRDRLTGNGVLAVNLWGSDKRFPEYRERLSKVFDGRVLCLPARQKGNVVAFGFRCGQNNPQWERLAERAEKLKAEYGLEFDEFVTDLARMNAHNDRRLFV